uniref:hypothetical protein n=1 Tax=uncultured Allobacillus sp. TaxID=1638025 RepID=UPI002595DEF6
DSKSIGFVYQQDYFTPNKKTYVLIIDYQLVFWEVITSFSDKEDDYCHFLSEGDSSPPWLRLSMESYRQNR